MLQLSDILIGTLKKGKSFLSHKYLREVHKIGLVGLSRQGWGKEQLAPRL